MNSCIQHIRIRNPNSNCDRSFDTLVMGKRKASSRPNRANKRQKTSGSMHSPGPGATSYSGPIVLRSAVGQQQITTRLFTYNTVATTTAAGILSVSATSQPNASPDWSDAAGMYQEYRVLGYKVTYMPLFLNYQGPTSTTPKQQSPFVVGINRGAITPPATYASALQLEGAKIGNSGAAWTISVRASGTNEMQWINTLSTAITNQVNSYANSLDVSTTYGVVFIQWLVQLRSPN